MIRQGEHYEQYKYRTKKDIIAYTGIHGHDIKTKYFHLKTDGTVIIYAGYAWDGCSGVPDLASTMLAGLLHDLGYQCLREELLLKWDDYETTEKYYEAFKKYRKRIDQLFEWTMQQDGAWWTTRKTYYRGVRILGEKYAKPQVLKDAA